MPEIVYSQPQVFNDAYYSLDESRTGCWICVVLGYKGDMYVMQLWEGNC